MKRKTELMIIGLGFILVAFCMAFAQGEANAEDVWQHNTMTGEVVEINPDAREITLEDSLRNKVTFAVDTKITNFEEFAVGDKVVADYYVSLAKEIRQPTEDEMKTPFMELEETEAAPPMASPKAGTLKMYRAVATVSSTDRAQQIIQFDGPRGNVVKVRASNPKWLGSPQDAEKPLVKVGDTVIFTYTEPLIVSIKKR